MPGPLSVECPQCGTKVKLKDRSKLGQKAACPQCRKPFVLAAPPEDDGLDDFEDFDDLGDYEEEEDAYEEEEDAAAPEPRRRSAAHSGKGGGTKKKKQPASQSPAGGKIALFVGGGVAALFLLVGVGLWALGVFSGDRRPLVGPAASYRPAATNPIANVAADNVAEEAANKIDVAYLRADAELIVHLKVAQAWQSPLFAELVEMPNVQEGLQKIQQTIGLAPTDVESVTFGLSGVSDQVKQGMNPNPMAATMAVRDNFLAVVRLTKLVDAASLTLVENGGQEATHSDQTYYRFQPPENNPQAQQAEPAAVFLAGPKLIVLGTEAKVKAAIAAGGKQPRRADLDFVDADQDLLIVFVPKDTSALTETLPNGGGGPDDPAGEMAKLAAKNLKALSIGIKVGSGLDMHLRANCINDAAAGEIKQLLDNLVAQGRASFQESKERMPPPLIAVIEPVLGSLQTSANSQTVTASINVSQSTIAIIKQSSGELAGMLMINAMMAGGGNGMFPGAPPMPGETSTPPVSATPSTLPTTAPEGLEVSAVARWSENQLFVSGGTESPRDLELWVYLIGKPAEQAVAWGFVKVKEAKGTGGVPLKLKVRQFNIVGEPTKEFIRVERGGFDNKHPDNGARSVISLDHPSQPVHELVVLEGSLKLRVPKQQTEVTIARISSLVGKAITHPELTAAKLRFQLQRENMVLRLSLVEGDPQAVGKITVVDANGKPIQNVSVFTFPPALNGKVSYAISSFGGELPATAALKVTVNLELTELNVPFRFENLPIPD